MLLERLKIKVSEAPLVITHAPSVDTFESSGGPVVFDPQRSMVWRSDMTQLRVGLLKTSQDVLPMGRSEFRHEGRPYRLDVDSGFSPEDPASVYLAELANPTAGARLGRALVGGAVGAGATYGVSKAFQRLRARYGMAPLSGRSRNAMIGGFAAAGALASALSAHRARERNLLALEPAPSDITLRQLLDLHATQRAQDPNFFYTGE